MKDILIVKMSSLGDIIQAFPVLDYLNHCHPQARINWAVEKPFAELVESHPFVYQALTVETKKWRSQFFKKSIRKEIKTFRQLLRQTDYDLVIDLQGNIKSGFVTYMAKSTLKVGFGYQTVPEWPNILTTHQRYNPPRRQNIREDYLFIVKNALPQSQPWVEREIKLKLNSKEAKYLKSYQLQFQLCHQLNILVCPSSNWPNKTLSQESLKSFLQSISNHFNAHFLFIWGNLDEKNKVEELAASLPLQSRVVPKLSLPSLQNLIAEMDLVIAMDSLPLHLAATTKTPTYSIFGPSLADKYQPKGRQHQSFQGTCPYDQKFEKRCPVLRTCKTGACMKNIEGQQLFDHFCEWWQS